MSHRYAMYGMVIDSDADLHQRRPALPDQVPDLVVRRVEEPPAERLPLGAPLLDFQRGRARYEAVRLPDGRSVLRFADACDFVVSADTGHVEVRTDHRLDDGIVTVLTAGALCAFVLYLRRRLVLHASAVETDDGVIAFVGHSGRGKSTCAALLCSDGARLVTDDVLVVGMPQDGTARAALGATELRLRQGADTLVGSFAQGSPDRRVSADGRQVLRLADDAVGNLPLSAVVVPFPSREQTDVEAKLMSASDALLQVLAFPRLEGWQDPVVVREIFEGHAELARRVPVVALGVPWGPPFRPGLGTEMAAAVHAVTSGIAAVPAEPAR